MIIIIDNYDSFTYNLYQALATLGHDIKIVRNDGVTVEEIRDLNPAGIVLSPGPGYPEKAGICIESIKQLGNSIPILGVCLGHQAIGAAFGATINRAATPLHGKDSLIYHTDGELFMHMPSPFKAGRYHSLVISPDTLPAELIIDAWDDDKAIMAVHHNRYPIYGVQFHPESILTPDGNQLLANFVNICNKRVSHA